MFTVDRTGAPHKIWLALAGRLPVSWLRRRRAGRGRKGKESVEFRSASGKVRLVDHSVTLNVFIFYHIEIGVTFHKEFVSIALNCST